MMPLKRKSTAKPPRLKKQCKTAKAEPIIADNLQQHERGASAVAAANDCANDALLDISINFTAINKVARQPGRRMAPPPEQGTTKLRVTWAPNREAPWEDTRNVEESAELLAKAKAARTRRTETQRQNTREDTVNVDSSHRTLVRPKRNSQIQDTKPIEQRLEATTEENVEESREGNAEESTEKNFETNTMRGAGGNIDPLNTEGSMGVNTEGSMGVNTEGNTGWSLKGSTEENTEPLAGTPAARAREKAPPKQKPQAVQDQPGPKDDAAATKPAKARPPRKRPPRPPREKWVDPDPYIPRTTISKHAKQPTPVSFPHPSTHVLESRPTQNGCLWCRWKHKLKPDAVKVKKSTVGCKECNIPLCRECFTSFHATG